MSRFCAWRVDVSDVGRVLADADHRLLVAVIAVDILLASLFPLRSHFVLRHLGAHVEPRVLIPAAILGNVAGSLTAASSGELLHRHAALPRGSRGGRRACWSCTSVATPS